MSPISHVFWTRGKNINGDIKNFLLNFFFFFFRKKKIYKSSQRAREAMNAFSKIFIDVPSKDHLISKHHLCTILSLSTVRVRRKNFSKICIDERHLLAVPGL